MQKIRTFIAIQIPPALEESFEALVREMKRLPGNVRWVKPQSIHITLNFLGEIGPGQVGQVFTGVEKAAVAARQFSLKTGIKGAFPSLKRPRVFWVGLTETNTGHLTILQKALEEEMSQLGFPKEERKFKPHLTVGRVKTPRGIEAISKSFMEYSFPEIEFTAEQVAVMKSELTPQGAIYSVQKAFSLKE